MSELAIQRLKGFKMKLVIVCISLLLSACWSIFNGPKGNLNGEPTPMIDSVLTWCVQFPIVSLVIFWVLYILIRLLHLSAVKSSISKQPHKHWGENTLELCEEKVSIITPTIEVTMDKLKISHLTMTTKAIYLMKDERSCYTCVPLTVGDSVIREIK